MKQLFTVFFATSSVFLYCQNLGPNWILGGVIGYNRSNNTALYTTSTDTELSQDVFTFKPYFGKSINDRWLAGVISRYSLNVTNYEINEDNKTRKIDSHAASLGLFARYRLNPENKLAFHIEPSVLVNLSKSTISERGDEILRINSFSYGIDITPVVTYEIGKGVNLIARFSAIGYEIGNKKIKGQSRKVDFSQFNGTLNLGRSQLGIEVSL